MRSSTRRMRDEDNILWCGPLRIEMGWSGEGLVVEEVIRFGEDGGWRKSGGKMEMRMRLGI
jgi:hypothetical protein